MLTEVMRHYSLLRPPVDAGFFETEHHAQVSRDIRTAIMGGRMIALTAVIGSGKTVLSRRLRADLECDGRVIVSRSLSVDKAKISMPLLIAALFYDLTPEKTVKTQASPNGGSVTCRSCSGGPKSPSRCSLTMPTTCIRERSLR